VVVVEGVVGFAVVPHPTTKALSATNIYASFMLERLSKDISDIAEGPANLMETLPTMFLYKKVITRTVTSYFTVLEFPSVVLTLISRNNYF
jgi:hypothetical protein